MSTPRVIRCREWMDQHNITFSAISIELGLKNVGSSRTMIFRETIPVFRYQQLRALGFPEEVLPIPLDLPRGRRPKKPDFPGLRDAQA